jgi:tRNA(Arg) A34 adenosine deaminase TadA
LVQQALGAGRGGEGKSGEPPGMAIHEARMRLALRQAKMAAAAGEVPVGAVIYNGSELAGQAWNQTRTLKDPTAHAEIIAITQAAAAAGDWRLTDSILYVTKEPCPMCAGAIVLARIPLVVWGMSDPLRAGRFPGSKSCKPRSSITVPRCDGGVGSRMRGPDQGILQKTPPGKQKRRPIWTENRVFDDFCPSKPLFAKNAVFLKNRLFGCYNGAKRRRTHGKLGGGESRGS